MSLNIVDGDGLPCSVIYMDGVDYHEFSRKQLQTFLSGITNHVNYDPKRHHGIQVIFAVALKLSAHKILEDEGFILSTAYESNTGGYHKTTEHNVLVVGKGPDGYGGTKDIKVLEAKFYTLKYRDWWEKNMKKEEPIVKKVTKKK